MKHIQRKAIGEQRFTTALNVIINEISQELPRIVSDELSSIIRTVLNEVCRHKQ